MSLDELLPAIGDFILLVNLTIYFIGFSKRKAYKIFLLYLILVFLFEVVFWLLSHYKKNNLFLSHYFFLGQFLLLALFYHKILKENYQKKIAILLITIVPFILIIQYLVYPNKYYIFNLFEIFITSYSVIILTLFHLYNLLDKKKDYYYITIGLLLYLISSTTIFLSGNLYTVMNKVMHKEIWNLNAFMFVVCQCFIFMEYYINKTNNHLDDE